jgi:plasmid stabilization system protein ParE
MTVAVPAEHRDWLAEQIAIGAYASPEAAVSDALHALRFMRLKAAVEAGVAETGCGVIDGRSVADIFGAADAPRPAGTVVLTAQAGRDLDEIAAFTAARWGPEQRVRYGVLLSGAVAEIAGTVPAAARSRDDLSPDCRLFRVARHDLAFRRNEAGAVLLRVLHVTLHAEPWPAA